MTSTTALLGPVAAHVGAAAAQTQDVQKASGAFTLTWLLVALPLLSAAILLLGGRRTDRFGHVLGTLVPWVGFVIALVMYIAMLSKPSERTLVRPAPVRLDPGRQLLASTPGCASTSCRWRSCCW